MHSRFSRPASAAASPAPAASRPAGHRDGYGAASVLPPLDEQAGGRPLPGEHPGSETARPQGPAPDRAIDPRHIGKYLVSPLIKVLENGWFACSVSIRSGCGSATTDRILRLTRLFRCHTQAASYAHAEGLQWISASGRPLAA